MQNGMSALPPIADILEMTCGQKRKPLRGVALSADTRASEQAVADFKVAVAKLAPPRPILLFLGRIRATNISPRIRFFLRLVRNCF